MLCGGCRGRILGVGNAGVAVDTGFLFVLHGLMILLRLNRLQRKDHALSLVAVATFLGIVLPQPVNFSRFHDRRMGCIFFRSVDNSDQRAPDLSGSFYLADHLGAEFLGYMAVGASRTDAADVIVVAGLLQLSVWVGFHFVAADTEFFSIGRV